MHLISNTTSEIMSSCFLLCLLFLLQITTLLSFSSSSSPRVEGNDTDRLSLLAFKDQINHDPLGILSSWNDSLHFCKWEGVTCGRRHQRVVEVDLLSCQLAGSLSPHIGNLSFLRVLNLANNSFTNAIPQEIGRLFRLRKLFLDNNTFSGALPVNISRCSFLSELWLGANKLTGKLPTELGSLSKLQEFVFEFNDLSGEIPPSFGNLSSILSISGGKNHLRGGFPSSVGQLRNLEVVYFGINNLSGTIPPSIYNLSSLTSFAFEFNQLRGSLPTNLGEILPNLEIFSVASNQFTGLIPATLSNASNLSEISLEFNFFTGKMPSLAGLPNLRILEVAKNSLGNGEDDDIRFLYDLANNTNLEEFSMGYNNFGGVLPEIVCNFSTKLRIMGVGNNPIRGSIPREIGNLISLTTLSFESNQLTGFIPSSIGKLRNLVFLNLLVNKITGRIPSSLGNVTSLEEVGFAGNNLQGRIPPSLGNCQNMLYLDLSQNNLSGPIPKEVIGISSLSASLYLSKNQLMGSLPPEVGMLANLGVLDVSENKLSGEIPKSLGKCLSLEVLYLGGNFFQGSIPQSLSSLRAIKDVNLSHNNLTGQISVFLAEFKLLTSLDLSFNDFEGEVPVLGVFKNASAILISGNNRLCGGIPHLNLSRCTFHESRKAKSSPKLILTIAIPCGFLIGSLLITLILFYRCRKAQNMPGSSWGISFPRVTYADLFQATGGFSSSNLIGAGSFGSVYKGIIAPEGAAVAVKVFDLLRKGASRSFMAECEALINIRHRNLVKVLTACSSIDFQGNDFKALVYEFMVNGSLDDSLHPIAVPEEAQEIRNLNLGQRLTIAINVANALDYLHHQCQIPVVHCDLKPSNVLLDCDMTAHVADFGLARFRPTDSDQSSLGQSSSTGAKGTIGYAAPEYGMGSKVSTFGDVYSYGILLLEIFTGKRPTDGLFNEELNLHNYIKTALPNHVLDVIDPIILREVEETTAYASDRKKRVLGCLISVLEVGLACSLELPRESMDISNVVAELNGIRGILHGTRQSGTEVNKATDGSRSFNVEKGAMVL